MVDDDFAALYGDAGPVGESEQRLTGKPVKLNDGEDEDMLFLQLYGDVPEKEPVPSVAEPDVVLNRALEDISSASDSGCVLSDYIIINI